MAAVSRAARRSPLNDRGRPGEHPVVVFAVSWGSPGGQPVPPSTLSPATALIMTRYVRPDTLRTSPPRKRRIPKSTRLVTRSIAYRSTQRPHGRSEELTVNVPYREVIDTGYAAAVIAVWTGMPLTEVIIVRISAQPSRKTADR